MMGNLQKVPNGALTLQFKGGGPLGTILATSDAEGNVRGYVTNPAISLLEKYAGKLDVGAAVGTERCVSELTQQSKTLRRRSADCSFRYNSG